jgi:NAD(P)H-quinone oxidoreductase subunit 3
MPELPSPWSSLFAFLVVSALVGIGILAAARLVGVRGRHESPLKRRTYECGEAPAGMAWMQFHARYYVVALLFVLFDVEAVFLFPWSVALRDLGSAGFFAGTGFIAVLMLGWLYAVRKGALEWQ